MAETVIEPADSAPVLQVELQAIGATCRLTLRGTLCQTSVAALQAQVDQLGCLPCHEVLVDLRGLTGLDEVGANLLLGLNHYVIARGGVFRVAGAAPAIADTLHSVAGTLIPDGGDRFSELPLALTAPSTSWNAP